MQYGSLSPSLALSKQTGIGMREGKGWNAHQASVWCDHSGRIFMQKVVPAAKPKVNGQRYTIPIQLRTKPLTKYATQKWEGEEKCGICIITDRQMPTPGRRNEVVFPNLNNWSAWADEFRNVFLFLLCQNVANQREIHHICPFNTEKRRCVGITHWYSVLFLK